MSRKHGMSLASQGIALPPIRLPKMSGDAYRGPRIQAVSDNSFPYSQPASSGPRQTAPGFTNYFEALTPSQDRTPIPLYSYALKSVLQTFNRVQLALIARYLYDNDGMVSLAVDTIADYCTPVLPTAATGDSQADRLLNEYFADWSRIADHSGRFSFSMLQRLACKAMDVDGDILPVMVGENGFPQIQLMETWRVDSRSVKDAAIRHMDGVRVDGKQAVMGYFVVNAFESIVNGLTAPEFVSANAAMLLYDPDRYSSYRGMSPLRRGGNDMRDAKDIKGFEKMAAKIHSALAAVIEGGTIEEDVWGNDTGLTGDATADGDLAGNTPPVPSTAQEKKLSLWELLGGDIPVLPPGQKLTPLQNNRSGAGLIDIGTYLGGYMVSGLGLPPSFIIQGGHTGPGERSVNGKAQRKFDNRQALLGHFAEWAWVRVIGDAIDKKILPAFPKWNKPEWQGPAKVSIDDGRDSDQWRQDVQSGLMTRQNHYGNRQLNWQTETDQGFAEDDYILQRAAERAEKFKVPVELILNKWGYSAARPLPTTPPGTQPDNGGGKNNETTK
ncbi:MAG: phage portal protein [Verrucomicrobiota bacterium]